MIIKDDYSLEDCEQTVNDAAKVINGMTEDIDRLNRSRDRLITALHKLAAWHDGEAVNPSFDEPHAASVARNALADEGIYRESD